VYILGTDNLGRDILAKTIYGARISMMVGLIGTLTAVLVGVIIGAISGYIGGWLDNLIMRFVDIMYGLPYMLIVIILMAMFRKEGESSIFILFIGIALVSWLTIARVVRGQIISLKNSEFVEAARSMGASSGRIIFRHLLPNAIGVIIVFTSLSLPSFIMNESFLSFLGMGVSAPLSSWGSLVSEGANTMELYPWQLLAPAIEMTLFLFCMNFLGDGLRDALDPQSKNRT
jgi:oligopeptide transport system permease protein